MGYINCMASGSGISGGRLQKTGTVSFAISSSIDYAEITPYLKAIDWNGKELGQATTPGAAGGNWNYSDIVRVTSSAPYNVSVDMDAFRSAFSGHSNLGGLRLNVFISASSEGFLNAEDFEFYFIPYTACYWDSNATCAVNKTLSTGNVTLSWSGAKPGTENAISKYEIQCYEYNSNGMVKDWTGVGTTTATSLSVAPPTTPGNYYKFRVRIQGAAGSQYYSSWLESSNALRRDHAALSGFTDSTLTAGTSLIKALHMTELQDRVNTLRTFYGLSKYSFTTITAGSTSLAGWTSHVNQIRAAIDEVCTASGKTHAAWISFSVNCPRADVIQQLRDVVLAL